MSAPSGLVLTDPVRAAWAIANDSFDGAESPEKCRTLLAALLLTRMGQEVSAEACADTIAEIRDLFTGVSLEVMRHQWNQVRGRR